MNWRFWHWWQNDLPIKCTACRPWWSLIATDINLSDRFEANQHRKPTAKKLNSSAKAHRPTEAEAMPRMWPKLLPLQKQRRIKHPRRHSRILTYLHWYFKTCWLDIQIQSFFESCVCECSLGFLGQPFTTDAVSVTAAKVKLHDR